MKKHTTTPSALPEEIKSDPVMFAQRLLKMPNGSPVEPHPGQVQLLRGVKATTVIAAGRQWGKSFCLGLYIVWFAVCHASREVLIIAPSLDQTRIIFNEIARHFRFGILAGLVRGKVKEFPFPEIHLINGTVITCRGANSPQFIRGHSPHLIVVDEAAFVKDSVITDVIEPLMTVTSTQEGSALVLISTPFGMGEFHTQFSYASTANDPKWSALHFTSLDNPHANKERLQKLLERVGESSLLWRTEYLAEFVDGDLSVFPWSDIKTAIDAWPYDADVTQRPPEAAHRYVQGVDLANVRDWFVSTILDVTDERLAVLVHKDRLQKKGYAYYKSLVRANYASYHRAKTMIDATSLGESVAEDLGDIGAEGYKFSNASKYDAVHELVRMFSEHRLAISPSDRDTIDELRFFQYELTASKNIRMEAAQGHDDIIMSLSLAAILAARPAHLGLFRGVNLTGPVKRPPIKKKQQSLTHEEVIKELFG